MPGLLAAGAAVAAALAAAPPAPGPSTRELERINWMELREWVPAGSETVLLPLGTLEAHGVTANGADILAPVANAPRIRTRRASASTRKARASRHSTPPRPRSISRA
jgi:hypothetical protein